jgi:hypothetical protein
MAEIDFNLLTALEALLSEGSVAGAARRLGLSESAMSRTLARLRAATGDPILVRAGRDMVPTPRAEAMRREVGTLTQAVRNVLQPDGAAFDPAGLGRIFNIRANESFAETFGARLVSAAAAAAPEVRLNFTPKPDKSVVPYAKGSSISTSASWAAMPDRRCACRHCSATASSASHGTAIRCSRAKSLPSVSPPAATS